MRSFRYVQMRKAIDLSGKALRRKWIAEIKEENDGEFIRPECSGCGDKLNLKDLYSYKYGFCCVNCGTRTFGLSWSDFY